MGAMRALLRIVWLVPALVVLCLSSPAIAGGGENHIGLRLHYASAGGDGLGGAVGHTYGFSDFWNLYSEVGWVGVLAPADDTPAMRHMGHVSLGTVYHIDAYQWVPYLRLTTGAYMAIRDRDEDPVTAAFGLGIGGGLDYRPARAWSIGLWGAYHVMLVGDVPDQGAGGLRTNLYF